MIEQHLQPLDKIEPEIDSSVIEHLEEMLQMAKEGKLSSVAFAYVWRDGAISTRWSYAYNQILLLGAVAKLQHRLAESIEV